MASIAYFYEKFGDASKYVNECILFPRNSDKTKKVQCKLCLSFASCIKYPNRDNNKFYEPNEYIVHLIAEHLHVNKLDFDAIIFYQGQEKIAKHIFLCPFCCVPTFYDPQNSNWKDKHSCFAKMNVLLEQLVEKPRRARFTFLTYHKLARNSKIIDPSNYLQMIDETTARYIVCFIK